MRQFRRRDEDGATLRVEAEQVLRGERHVVADDAFGAAVLPLEPHDLDARVRRGHDAAQGQLGMDAFGARRRPGIHHHVALHAIEQAREEFGLLVLGKHEVAELAGRFCCHRRPGPPAARAPSAPGARAPR
jgi:hypothetical protein